VQGARLLARSARFESAQRWGTGQRFDTAYRGLHQGISAQRIVVVEVFVAAAQPLAALGQQIAQTVPDARWVARIAQHGSGRAAQTDAFIDLAQQHQPTVRTQIPTIEIRFDDASAHTPKFNPLVGTFWHRQLRLFIDFSHQ
jgi:hypothetical protein